MSGRRRTSRQQWVGKTDLGRWVSGSGTRMGAADRWQAWSEGVTVPWRMPLTCRNASAQQPRRPACSVRDEEAHGHRLGSCLAVLRDGGSLRAGGCILARKRQYRAAPGAAGRPGSDQLLARAGVPAAARAGGLQLTARRSRPHYLSKVICVTVMMFDRASVQTAARSIGHGTETAGSLR
jgi:hypothetical protein